MLNLPIMHLTTKRSIMMLFTDVNGNYKLRIACYLSVNSELIMHAESCVHCECVISANTSE